VVRVTKILLQDELLCFRKMSLGMEVGLQTGKPVKGQTLPTGNVEVELERDGTETCDSGRTVRT